METNITPDLIELRHSKLGIASFIISLVTPLILFLLLIFSMALRNSKSNVAALIISFIVLVFAITSLTGIGLGIAGILRTNCKKVFGIIGLVINGISIILLITIIIIGNLTTTDKPSTINVNKDIYQKNVDPKILFSRDGQSQLILIDGWVKKEEDDVIVEATALPASRNSFLTLSVTDKINGTTDNLTEQFKNEISFGVKDITNPQITGPIKTTIADYPALQFEINGESAKGIMSYQIYTIIETLDKNYIIYGYTQNTDYNKNRNDILKITNSFSHKNESSAPEFNGNKQKTKQRL